MTTERVTLASERDGLALSLLLTMPESPMGIVQIAHGMAEHKERYAPLMEFLATHGYACVAHDLRGHGESVVNQDDLGYFGAGGAEALVEDLRQVTGYARGHWPNLPLILLGHSMGSLVSRAYLKKYTDLNGLILSGTPSYQAAISPAGIMIALIRLFKGERYRSALLGRLFVGSFNRGIKNPASPYAWLNTDTAAVEAYDRDPLCGFLFTVNGFETLRSLLIRAHDPRGWAEPKKTFPVLFLSGASDPCMISREKLSEAVNLLRNVGYPHIKVKLYDGMRHEILNEPEHAQVYADISSFLTECLKGNGKG